MILFVESDRRGGHAPNGVAKSSVTNPRELFCDENHMYCALGFSTLDRFGCESAFITRTQQFRFYGRESMIAIRAYRQLADSPRLFSIMLKIERGERAGVVEFEPGWDDMWRDPHHDEQEREPHRNRPEEDAQVPDVDLPQQAHAEHHARH